MEIKTQFKEQMIEKTQKRTRNFFIRLICVAFSTVILLSYFALPISKVKSCNIEGNYYLSRKDVLETIGVNENTFLFEINKENADEYLSNHPLVNETNISHSFFHLNIEIDEISPSVRDFENNVYLKNGQTIDLEKYKNIITSDMIEKLPFILSSNDSYYSTSTNTRYILYELSLIFVTLFNVDIDYVDFKNNFFVFYLKLDEKYDKLFNDDNSYIEFMFDASCMANHYKSDSLIKVIEKFNLKLSSFFDEYNLTDYVNNEIEINGEIINVKSIYVYPIKKDKNNIEITFTKQVESEG